MTFAFVHGAYGHSSDFDEVRAGLEPSVALSLPGHDFEAAHDFEHAVDLLLQQLPKRSVGVGYSMGGRLLLSAARKAPERFLGLVLESAHIGNLSDEARKKRLILDEQRARDIQENPEAFLSAFWSLDLFKSFAAHPKRSALLAARVKRAQKNKSDLAKSVLAMSVAHQPDATEMLSQNARPILFIAGALDAKYVSHHASVVAAANAQSECLVIEGAGHNVHQEARDAYIKALKRFAAKARLFKAKCIEELV